VSLAESSEGLYLVVPEVTTFCVKLALKTTILFLLRFSAAAVALMAIDSLRQYPPLCISTDNEIDPKK